MKFYAYILLAMFVIALVPSSATAQGFSTIRDDEIERYIKDIGAPLFKAGELESDNIKFFIVNDPSLNAFVAGGQNMFLHTGLILEDEQDPSMLIGVMAHETGHIIGGHLARKRMDAEAAGVEAGIGYVLGILAVAAGAPDAGLALIAGGTHLAGRGLLKHSREHEESADEAAMKLLKAVKISPAGLLKLLKKLGTEMALAYGDKIDPYRLTHPVSSQRVSRIHAAFGLGKAVDYPTPAALKKRHQRLAAKLKAFLVAPKDTIKTVKEDGTAINHYALAIAYYRALELEKALELINGLIKQSPNDPYYYELKGQMLFERAKVVESIEPYKKAVEILPDSALLRTALAISLLSLEDEALQPQAIEHLEKALLVEPKNPLIWYQLGIGYGREGFLGKSYLALAERENLFKNVDEARKYIKLASEHIDLKSASPDAIKANDLMKILKLTH
jgi:predicted Zn-dependent protease